MHEAVSFPNPHPKNASVKIGNKAKNVIVEKNRPNIKLPIHHLVVVFTALWIITPI